MATVLITGASGLIGSALTKALLADGHVVHHVGRSTHHSVGIRSFVWHPAHQTMDANALIGVEHIVHLAGAGIADKRWSDARVRELIESRADSARLLLRTAKAEGTKPKSFVSAAGIGYYGAGTSERLYTEDDPPGTDTIAHISAEWERAVDEWRETCRVVKLRTPLVLAREGGALPKLAGPIRWGIGSPLGSGKQWVPWVHIDDLVRAYQQAIVDDEMNGPYNVIAGNATNALLMRAVAKALGRPFFLPRVPRFVLKLMLGALSSLVLEGSRASGEKLLSTGFHFKHPELEEGLRKLLTRS